MIFAQRPRTIRVMFTPFRDGLQSVFGGKVRLDDFLPAMQRAAEVGIRHFEFGGGARFQAPLFYLGENPFECMRRIRQALGPDVDLQILTRSVSGVTLVTQSLEGLALQARLMAKNGTTWDRNFDYMNDVDNLVRTGQPIVDAGMHHQVCIAMMGLPFESATAHTADYYIDVGRRLLASGLHIDSMCMKDASGTASPATIYHTAVGLRKIMPPEMPLWMHSHDTASTAVSCYQAAIHGGADGVDLSCRPLASGTSQPDVRSLAHVLKGSGYSLDVDVSVISGISRMLDKALSDYEFDPAATMADARVLGFPMPGGAIGPNIHMMVKAGIRERYGEVLAEMRNVVEAGGAWTSVTPGSQQYWLQAFNNVLYGRWKKIDTGYGKAVLGYFGRTPLPPDPQVLEQASAQLGLPPFDGDPLDAAPDNIGVAQDALRRAGLEVNDENVFLVLSSIVPGRKMESNEGLRFLLGNPKIDIPLKKAQEAGPAAAPAVAVPAITGPVTTQVSVKEGDRVRRFTVTVEPAAASAEPSAGATAPATAPAAAAPTPVYSTFGGAVELVDILVTVGDAVRPGTVVAQVEAMKARHDIRTPIGGTVVAVHAKIGDEIDGRRPVISIG
jgi:pyruvate carboxylase subunit B